MGAAYLLKAILTNIIVYPNDKIAARLIHEPESSAEVVLESNEGKRVNSKGRYRITVQFLGPVD